VTLDEQERSSEQKSGTDYEGVEQGPEIRSQGAKSGSRCIWARWLVLCRAMMMMHLARRYRGSVAVRADNDRHGAMTKGGHEPSRTEQPQREQKREHDSPNSAR
jgi:hypothetical protein